VTVRGSEALKIGDGFNVPNDDAGAHASSLQLKPAPCNGSMTPQGGAVDGRYGCGVAERCQLALCWTCRFHEVTREEVLAKVAIILMISQKRSEKVAKSSGLAESGPTPPARICSQGYDLSSTPLVPLRTRPPRDEPPSDGDLAAPRAECKGVTNGGR
jgi:hypothetical protein